MTQQPGHRLTRNQALVFGVLENTDGPLSAYAILDMLRDEGLKAPLQIYRALEKLVDLGLVHRLESLNAFLACQHPGDHAEGVQHASVAFAICDTCESVSEIRDRTLTDDLARLAAAAGLELTRSAVELHGKCRDCRARDSAG